MAEIKRLKKGLDICLYGEADANTTIDSLTDLFAIIPDDFPGITWKLSVKPGDKVAKGSPVMHDKPTSKIYLTSPVSGIVESVIRGERRKIESVIIRKDNENSKLSFEKPVGKEGIISTLCGSGLWAIMHQRPYDIIPQPDIEPRDIFITAFDSAPLATPIINSAELPMLEEGIKLLSQLTSGKVYLGVKFGSGISSATAEVIEFQGPHPCGNVGVQIANIKPVNKGEIVWTLDARTVVRIGTLATTGELDTSTNVAVTGPLVNNPHIIQTTFGASLPTLLKGMIAGDKGKPRVISGNVLTGTKVNPEDGFLRFPYRQISIIAEGDDADEFMGWASLNPNKFSVKHSFPAFLKGLSRPFNFDARIKGGHRAMIVSGEYDKVFPMDIYPEYLLKAIIASDIDKMEQLGIYEVAPEDFALAEFVDTSKIPIQEIVRNGLDKLRAELS